MRERQGKRFTKRSSRLRSKIRVKRCGVQGVVLQRSRRPLWRRKNGIRLRHLDVSHRLPLELNRLCHSHNARNSLLRPSVAPPTETFKITYADRRSGKREVDRLVCHLSLSRSGNESKRRHEKPVSRQQRHLRHEIRSRRMIVSCRLMRNPRIPARNYPRRRQYLNLYLLRRYRGTSRNPGRERRPPRRNRRKPPATP